MSHVDQLTFVFRFVKGEKGRVVERFLAFEPIHSHTGSSLAACVQKMVSDLGLDLADCRGQSYDNASNMSGKRVASPSQKTKPAHPLHPMCCTFLEFGWCELCGKTAVGKQASFLIYCKHCMFSVLPPSTDGIRYLLWMTQKS